MNSRTIYAAVVATAIAALPLIGADLDVRHFYKTNDVSGARAAVSPLVWYQGDSVKLDLYVRRGTAAVDLSASGLFAVWEAAGLTNNTTLYISDTGTVANATNGYLTFSLAVSEANLPTNTYDSWVKLYQPVNGTNTYVGTAYRTTVQVLYSPSATNIAYAGPFTNGYILNWGNVTQQGTAPFVATTDSAYLAALTNATASGNITVTLSGRTVVITGPTTNVTFMGTGYTNIIQNTTTNMQFVIGTNTYYLP